jgi:hypothetical protein
VRAKKKTPTDGQIISELGFGFWRFLLARRYQSTLWPDLASGFPHAPNRARRTVEDPIVRLHEFRNRLAHHQRIWSERVEDRYQDCLLVAGYIDGDLRDWIAATSRVPDLLSQRPQCLKTTVHCGRSDNQSVIQRQSSAASGDSTDTREASISGTRQPRHTDY